MIPEIARCIIIPLRTPVLLLLPQVWDQQGLTAANRRAGEEGRCTFLSFFFLLLGNGRDRPG